MKRTAPVLSLIFLAFLSSCARKEEAPPAAPPGAAPPAAHSAEPAPAAGSASLPVPAPAGEAAPGYSHEKSSIHGGKVVMTTDHHFECVFTEDAVLLYGYDGRQEPIDLKDATGEARVYPKEGGPTTMPFRFVPGKGREPGYLEARFSFGKVAPTSRTVGVSLFGLKAEGERTASFSVLFEGITRPDRKSVV